MPIQSRRYISTATDRVRERIAAVAEILRNAEQAVADAESALGAIRDARNHVLREEYADGVDPRDLVEILEKNGVGLTRQQVTRIVSGARSKVTKGR